MIATEQTLENLTLTINQEIHVQAPLDVTFAALLEQLGPGNQTPDGKSLNMKIEPWPGGRWYRDLGNNDGHFWGHVQAIKRPTLLEISGPLFMSYPAVSNVQYRLSEMDGGTLIKFRHTALGLIQDDHREGVSTGWGRIHARVRRQAESWQIAPIPSPPQRQTRKENPMLAQALLAEFEAQAPVTRKFLERLPDNKLTWKPHPAGR